MLDGPCSSMEKPHAVLIPYPTAGQLNPMLQLAQLLQSKGFFVTFVNTEFSHRQLLQRGGGLEALTTAGDGTLRFVTVPDGTPPEESDRRGPDHLVELWLSIKRNCPAALAELLMELGSPSSSAPPLTCVITNYLMTFTQGVAAQLGVPELVFWTTSACGLMASLQLPELIRRGYVPLKDESCLTNGYLETTIDWIPGMKDLRLGDLSSFIRTTDQDDIFLRTEVEEVEYALKAWGLILNTVEDLESEVLHALRRRFFPRLYTVGAIGSLLAEQLGSSEAGHLSMRLGFWQEDDRCIDWLDSHEPASVVYVSFGSLTVLTTRQLTEFAWGLADSEYPFLWVIRPDMVEGGAGRLPPGFIEQTKGRSFVASWCDQGRVLAHPAVAGFLTHGGWNSMLESVACGVPMVCWPGFAEQYTNCRYACDHWGVGVEVEQDTRREQVRGALWELMEGERGRSMRKNASRWKETARRAIRQSGSSSQGLVSLVQDITSK